jgi:hypothetical protein
MAMTILQRGLANMKEKCLCQPVTYNAVEDAGWPMETTTPKEPCKCAHTVSFNGIRLSDCMYRRCKEKLEMTHSTVL